MFLRRIPSEELLPLKSEFRRVWKKKGNEKLTFYIYKTFRYSKVGSKNFRVPSLVKLIIFHFEWKISNIIPYMYPVNIPVNPYKLNLARKVINTCTVLRKICLSVKAQLPPLTRVIASSHLLDPRSQFFFDATLRMRLSSILFLDYYFPSSCSPTNLSNFLLLVPILSL